MSQSLPMLGVSLAQSSSAQKSLEAQTKMQAELEDVAAMQRETDRKMDLARAIGSIRAGAGAAGIATNVGSPLSVIQETIRMSETDQSRDDFNTLMRKQSAAFRTKLKSGELRANRALSVIEFGDEAAETYMTGGIS